MAIRLDHGEDELTEVHDINVTPFIDVMLVLLIIFMGAAPLATVDVPVDLPSSNAQQQQRPNKPVFVTIKADHTLAIGEDPVTPGTLAAALDAATGSNKEERIFLRSDRSVPYGDVVQVLDVLRAASYLKIALVGLENRSAQLTYAGCRGSRRITPAIGRVGPSPPLSWCASTPPSSSATCCGGKHQTRNWATTRPSF